MSACFCDWRHDIIAPLRPRRDPSIKGGRPRSEVWTILPALKVGESKMIPRHHRSTAKSVARQIGIRVLLQRDGLCLKATRVL